MTIVETLSNSVKDSDRKAKSKEIDFNKDEQKEWQQREEIGETSILEKTQQMGKQRFDDSFIGTRIEYLYEFDLVGE